MKVSAIYRHGYLKTPGPWNGGAIQVSFAWTAGHR